MRAGVRFVRNTPAIRHAMVRTIAYSLPASAPWALLPLVVREQLHLGAGMYGVILGMMGVGGVTSGMLLPMVRGRMSRNATVVGCSPVLLRRHRLARHRRITGWSRPCGMLLFGIGWTSAYATIQAAAQLVCPPWVRARALSIYQLAQNGALTVGSFAWGALGGQIGMAETLLVAAGLGVALALSVQALRHRVYRPGPRPNARSRAAVRADPKRPPPELVPLLRHARGQVMETMHYRVAPGRARRVPGDDAGGAPGARPGRRGVLAALRGRGAPRGLAGDVVDGELDRPFARGRPAVGGGSRGARPCLRVPERPGHAAAGALPGGRSGGGDGGGEAGRRAGCEDWGGAAGGGSERGVIAVAAGEEDAGSVRPRQSKKVSGHRVAARTHRVSPRGTFCLPE